MPAARYIVVFAIIALLTGCVSVPPIHHTAIARGLSAPDPCGFTFAEGVVRIGRAVGEPTVSWCQAGIASEAILKRVHDGLTREPVNIVGHSLGADAAVRMAHFLRDHGVKVGWVILYDPTRHADLTGFRAIEFRSHDIRAVDVSGATIIRRPDLGHVELPLDPRVRAMTLERIR